MPSAGRFAPDRVRQAALRRIGRGSGTAPEPRIPWSSADLPELTLATVVVGIGPANFAGQGWAWKQAVERNLTGVSAEVFAVQRKTLNFPADHAIQRGWYRDPGWQAAQRDRVLNGYTHLLAEAVRPVFRDQDLASRARRLLSGDTLAVNLPVLRRAGIPVAMVLHGSEIRRPSRHAERYPHSPFADPNDQLTRLLQRQSVRLGRIVEAFAAEALGPIFVSTPDLLDEVASAIWLPVVVDDRVWRADRPVLERAVPVVVHVPSSAKMKGSQHIEPTVAALAARGVIDYRRYEGVDPQDMPGLIADADIVLDQFALGSYGVAAVQSMMAGRITVGHVAEHVRARINAPLPIVEATGATIGSVIQRLLDDRDSARAIAASGTAFAEGFHNGRKSAEALSTFLGAPLRVT